MNMWTRSVNSYLSMVLIGVVALMASLVIIKVSRLEPSSSLTVWEAISVY